MKIFVNGVDREVGSDLSVQGLLASLALGENRVAVAVNREVVLRKEHGSRTLVAGDKVEIVHAVQGG